MVLGIHHCLANCIVLNALDEFYPEAVREFREMLRLQKVPLPKGVAGNLTDEQYDQLFNSTIIHQKPLINALGDGYREILSHDKVESIFRRM